MATTQPYAYNTGTTIPSTTQVGDLVVGLGDLDYSSDYGGVKWWMGPNEDTKYVIGSVRPSGQPVPAGVTGTAQVGFWGSKFKTEESFLNLANYIGGKNGQPPFATTNDATTWLNANGYYTSYDEVTPTPTSTLSVTPTPTPTGVGQLINPILVGLDEYLEVGTDEYLMFVDPAGPTPTPSVTPTNTETSTPTPSVTNTQTPSVTPTFTPTPSTSPIPVTGYGYNLVVLPYNPPTSGNTIFPTFATPILNSGTTNPNTFTTNGVYWNTIDNLGFDRSSYYSGMTGLSVTAYFTQNGETSIYSGSTTAFLFDGPIGQQAFNYNPNLRPNQLVLIQSASTNFVTGQTVYISYVVN
jgi:hypothetical protein